MNWAHAGRRADHHAPGVLRLAAVARSGGARVDHRRRGVVPAAVRPGGVSLSRSAHVIPLHYNVAGIVDRRGPMSQAFILPLIGLLALGANTLLGGLFYRREQMASYLLWGGAIIVQLLLWIGTVNLLRI